MGLDTTLCLWFKKAYFRKFQTYTKVKRIIQWIPTSPAPEIIYLEPILFHLYPLSIHPILKENSHKYFIHKNFSYVLYLQKKITF